MAETKRKPGRQKGSKTQKLPVEPAEISRCRACGSTDREPYFGTAQVLEFAGTEGGKPYTHTIWRRTKCRQCGQIRIDRHRENRSA